MKKILFVSFALFALHFTLLAQIPEDITVDGAGEIVGGAGFIKFSGGNPNINQSIKVIDERLYAAFAWDTLNNRLWQYKRTLPIGHRWKLSPFVEYSNGVPTWSSRDTATKFVVDTFNRQAFICNQNGCVVVGGSGAVVTVSNGLSFNIGGDVQLGGILTQPTTTLYTSPTNTLRIKGLQSGLDTDSFVVVDGFTGQLRRRSVVIPNFDTSRILWNGGNYDVGGITIGTKQNASIDFITNNTFRGTWSNIGLAIGSSSPFGHSLFVNGSTHVNGLHLNEPLQATDFSQMLLRNANDGYLYKASINDVVINSYLQNLDTIFAYAGREYQVTPLTHDIVICSRLGIQSVYDSLVFNFNFIPSKNQEVNIYVQGNARLWVMDLIFKTKMDASTGYSTFEEGNGNGTSFFNTKEQQCIEFGAAANNPNYNTEVWNVPTGTVWKVALKYNSINKKWLLVKMNNAF